MTFTSPAISSSHARTDESMLLATAEVTKSTSETMRSARGSSSVCADPLLALKRPKLIRTRAVDVAGCVGRGVGAPSRRGGRTAGRARARAAPGSGVCNALKQHNHH